MTESLLSNSGASSGVISCSSTSSSSSSNNNNSSRIVGVAAPQRQQQQPVNSLTSLLTGSHGVIQASSVGTPLHLMARNTTATDSGVVATANNSGGGARLVVVAGPPGPGTTQVSSSWATSASVNNNNNQAMMMDHWQQGQQLRVPLASPEPTGTVGPLLTTTAAASASSSTVPSQQPRISGSSRFYCTMNDIANATQPSYQTEARNGSAGLCGAYSVAAAASRLNSGSNYDNSGSGSEPAVIIRPQTFHATTSIPLPLSTTNNLLFPISRSGNHQPVVSHLNTASGTGTSNTASMNNNSNSNNGSGSGSVFESSDDASTVTNNTAADDGQMDNGSNLDMSGISQTPQQQTVQNYNHNNHQQQQANRQSFLLGGPQIRASSSQINLAPLELVEQLNRLLTVGDIVPLGGFPINQNQSNQRGGQSKVAKLHRRAGFVLPTSGTGDNSDSGSNSSSSQRNSPSAYAARRLRSVSMPLVQVGNSSKSQFDSSTLTICGERLARHLKTLRHFDLQSVKFSLANTVAVLEQVTRTAKTPSNLNTTTGASAATLGSVRLYDDLSTCSGSGASAASNNNNGTNTSGTSGNNNPPSTQVAPELRDQGDGRSNGVIQSCPYFRNEISTEEVRSVHLGRATVAKQMLRLSGGSSQDDASASSSQQQVSHPICNAVTVIDHSSASSSTQIDQTQQLRTFGGFRVFTSGFVVEHHDFGAHLYRDSFVGREHHNYVANHPTFGPVVVSLLRERVPLSNSATGQVSNNLLTRSGFSLHSSQQQAYQYQHRVIVRTADMVALRGTLPDDAVPYVPASSSGGNKKKGNHHQGKDQVPGPSPSDLIAFLLPEVNNVAVFRHETDHERVEAELLRIDEQNVRYKYKFGVIYCRPGQSSEEEYYNNPSGSALFEDFLGLLGRRVQLRNFSGYSGGLDTKADTTGQESVYASFAGFEVMFHVSTLLPFSPTNRQQLLRKRHIGNDVVTIIFQEPGSQPFTPRAIRSQYQHVFIVVRPILGQQQTVAGYQVAVSRAKDTAYFGPLLPPEGIFAKSREFGEFLLAKAINAENAVVKSGKFVTMALRTRRELLLDLVNNHSSQDAIVSSGENSSSNGGSGGAGSSGNGSNSVVSSGFAGASRLMRLSFRRVFRDRTANLLRGGANQQGNQGGVGSSKSLAARSQLSLAPHVKNLSAQGGYAWNVVLLDCGQGGHLVQATLVLSTDDFVLLDREANQAGSPQGPGDQGCPSTLLQSPAVFCVPLKSLLGYRVQHTDLRVYYHKGESILLRSVDGSVDEIDEIVQRISVVSGTVEFVPALHSVSEVTLVSPIGVGRFGFLCSAQGIVLRVDDGGPAANCGLRPGCRIIEVFAIALRALTGAQLRELFQSAQRLNLSVLPALPSGAPRQSRVQPETPTMYWLPQYFHAMSPEFVAANNSSAPNNNNNSANQQMTTQSKPAAQDIDIEISVVSQAPMQETSGTTSGLTPRSSASSYVTAMNTQMTTPVAGFAQNRIYAELPSAGRFENGRGGNNSARTAAQSTDSLVEATAASDAAFFTPAGSRRPVFLPATTASAYSPLLDPSNNKPGINNSSNNNGNNNNNNNNYQLHRWPMNGSQQTTPGLTATSNAAANQQGKSTSGELVDVGASTTSNVGLLEAQLAVERSRRLAAEHELAAVKHELSEMRQVVKQFTDWFVSVPSSGAVSGSPQQRLKLRQWQSSLAAMATNNNPNENHLFTTGEATNQTIPSN